MCEYAAFYTDRQIFTYACLIIGWASCTASYWSLKG